MDGLHLAWSSTGLNDDLRPWHISREAVFILQCFMSMILPDFMFKVYSNIALAFFTEFQPQSESGIPPEYPKERMIPIGCQVDQKIFQITIILFLSFCLNSFTLFEYFVANNCLGLNLSCSRHIWKDTGQTKRNLEPCNFRPQGCWGDGLHWQHRCRVLSCRIHGECDN